MSPAPSTKKPRKAPQKPPKKAPASIWRRIIHTILLVCDTLAAALLCLGAYNGYINPASHGGYWGIVGLGFPLILAATALLLLLQLIIWRKGAIIPAAAMLVCAGPILNYFPLNIIHPKAAKDARLLKVMTYNVYSFKDIHPEQDPDATRNRTMNTIIESGADIVCLQETEAFGAHRDRNISPEDMTLLSKIYPVIVRTDTYLVLLSKYPVDEIRLDQRRKEFGGDIAAYRVNIDDTTAITFFNLHLQSLGLTAHDKNIYRDLTDGKARKKSELKEIKNSLLAKVAAANVARAEQADKIARYIELFGGPNVIVCGDFNDAVGSYTIRRLARLKLREVYPEVGFGPIVTYNARRFYFGIDHILWRGNLRPLSLEKGTIPSSDHFPLTAVFEIE
ncbi:MAG: endonuclease/exonuclease/phosphatase family protein [Muribaculaceae bacterium]|nr:endonuclease/exonuclease/phosphatase family protein [Muribaculaceae bacterium]